MEKIGNQKGLHMLQVNSIFEAQATKVGWFLFPEMFEEVTQEMERWIKRRTQDEEEWIHASLTAVIKSIKLQNTCVKAFETKQANKEVKSYPETGILAASGRTQLPDLNIRN